MAGPLITALFSKKLGRTIYRQSGRFISRQTYRQRFVTGGASLSQKGIRGMSPSDLARAVMNKIGPPIGGGNWVSRTRQSSERFIELVGENNELG